MGQLQRGSILAFVNIWGIKFRNAPIMDCVNSRVGRLLCVSIPERVNTGVDQLQSGQFRHGAIPERVNSDGGDSYLCKLRRFGQCLSVSIPDRVNSRAANSGMA